jgi:SnoaL-like polyketide cyclase
VSQVPERAELDVLAERWSGAWLGEVGFAELCTAGVNYEDPLASLPLVGSPAIAEHAAAMRRAFPDARIERTAPALWRGEHACLPWRLIGTHTGEVGALPATEKFVSMHGLHYVELSDGLVHRARGFFDLYDASTQLGLLPERGGLGEAVLLLLRGFGLRR